MQESRNQALLIRREIDAVAALYQIPSAKYALVIDQMDLGRYVEIILLEDGFEVVVGGVGQEVQLIDLGRRIDVNPAIISGFTRMVDTFPGKMVYLKAAFGPSASPPTLYSTVIEPWAAAKAFLNQFNPPPKREAWSICKANSAICFMLAFSADVQGRLLTKTYRLADRVQMDGEGGFGARDGIKATMICRRLTLNGIDPRVKTYKIGVAWPDVWQDTPWPRLCERAQTIFSTAHPMALGELWGGDERISSKLYLFRADDRTNASYNFERYNFYHDEALSLVKVQSYDAAIRAYCNAIDYQPDCAHAYNDRGFCKLMLGDAAGAVADCRQALALDDRVSSANLRAAEQALGNG